MNLEPYNATIIPSRTRYQLRQFVIGAHDTPAMRWRQVLLEAQDLAYKIRLAELDVEEKRIEIHRLLSTGDPIDAIEAERKQLGIVVTERGLAGARLELSWVCELADEIGAYTPEEIEADQPAYWAARLQRQAGLDRMAIQEGISAGNLGSMLNAGLLNKENSNSGLLDKDNSKEKSCAILPTN
jgi:hypothetical protein